MLFVVLITTILILYWWLKQKPSISEEPPLHIGFLPIIGHAFSLIGDSKYFWCSVKKLSNQCIAAGNVTTFVICGRKFYLITDPEDCLTVANSCFEKDLIYRSAKACFGDGLVTASINTWKEHRSLLNSKFNVKYLLSFMGVFNKQSKILLKQLESKVQTGPFDHGVIIRHNGMETICLTSLGVDFSTDKETLCIYANAFDLIFNSLTEQIQRFWLHFSFFWRRSSLKKKRDYNRDVMNNITERIIQQRKEDQQNSKINDDCDEAKHFKPFLDVFFELKKTGGNDFMSDETIRDHVNTLILAGHDTIAAALQFTLILIGSYPEVQGRLYEEWTNLSRRCVELYTTKLPVKENIVSKPIYSEIVAVDDIPNSILGIGHDFFKEKSLSSPLSEKIKRNDIDLLLSTNQLLYEVFGDSDRDVEKEDLGMLIYLDAVLKETLRVYTIAPIVARYVHEDVQLKNFTLAAGNCCVLLLHGVHRHPMWGDDAEEFKPERWLDPNTLPDNPNAFIAFSLGRRFCIGKTYAMISMKTTVAHILRKYRITADHTKMDLKLECLLKPVSGHYISIERR